MPAKDPHRLLARVAFAACLLPLLWLVVRGVRGDLGADPIAEVLNRLGFDAFVLLMLTLACTPAQLILKQGWPARLRRLFGDYAFFYACLHLSTWLFVDQGLDLHEIAKDLVKRRFIVVGMATFLLLLPLAVTSTRGWQQRLGFRRWKRLHRLVYLAGALACVHFIWRFKTALVQPLAWTAVFLGLLAIRLGFRLARAVPARPARAGHASAAREGARPAGAGQGGIMPRP